MRWRDDLSEKKWDHFLSKMGGHSLQSALWGNAKRVIYGIFDQRLALYRQEKLIALIRIENRGLKWLPKLAWVPQGPVLDFDVKWQDTREIFLQQLKKMGYRFCVFFPWQPATELKIQKGRKTIWIDLQLGKQKLWLALDKQWRYGVRYADRCGIQSNIASSTEEVADFYQLCIEVSNKKNFSFKQSKIFLQYLLDHSDTNGVEAKLFLVKCEKKIVAGAFVLRAGKNVHYMFGAVDRKYAKQRAGEFVQWSVIEWACDHQCARYDLEGIDEIKNPGVAAFKKKMGGELITLQDPEIYSFDWKGKWLSSLIQKKLM